MSGSTHTYFPSGADYPVSSLNITIASFGVQEPDCNHRHGPVVKAEHVLQYVTEGAGTLVIRGKSDGVAEGDLFYLPKNVLLTYYAQKSHPYRYHWLGIDGAGATQILGKIGLTADNPVMHVEGEELKKHFLLLEQAVRSNSLVGYLAANGRMMELLSYLLSLKSENLKTLENVGTAYVNTAVEYIKNNFGADLSVTQLADAVGLNRTYFSVLFKRHAGLSPVEYLMQYRLDQARKMLAQGMRVTEVAISCGFNSPANFSVQFKNATGLTPFEYRKSVLSAPRE